MPIKREFRKFYGQHWRENTRPRILRRANNRCEECKKPNGRHVWVFANGPGSQCWTLFKNRQNWFWRGQMSKEDTEPLVGQHIQHLRLNQNEWRAARRIRVVLTIAHLNHVSGDDRDDNLKALCQWCHLNYDKLHHKETRAARKDAARPLLVTGAAMRIA